MSRGASGDRRARSGALLRTDQRTVPSRTGASSQGVERRGRLPPFRRHWACCAPARECRNRPGGALTRGRPHRAGLRGKQHRRESACRAATAEQSSASVGSRRRCAHGNCSIDDRADAAPAIVLPCCERQVRRRAGRATRCGSPCSSHYPRSRSSWRQSGCCGTRRQPRRARLLSPRRNFICGCSSSAFRRRFGCSPSSSYLRRAAGTAPVLLSSGGVLAAGSSVLSFWSLLYRCSDQRAS